MRISWALGLGSLVGWTSGCDPAEHTAAVSQAQTVYCVLNAHTDVGTVHFQGPDWLLASTEAIGPLELNVRVQQYVQPAMSVTADVKLDPATISNAVGYSMAERYEIQGGAREGLLFGEHKRMEAYTAYQRTVWEIRDANCAVPLGTGTSFKPIGLYFRVVDAAGLTLPDLGFYAVAPSGGPGGVSAVSPATQAPLDQSAPGAATKPASDSASTQHPSAEPVDPGVAPETQEIEYCILNVHTDAETIHVEGPTRLLGSVEGAGGLKLDLRILDFIIPTVSVSGHYKPKASTLSTAVGYSVQHRYGVHDSSRLDVAENTFQRVEAYTNYQRTVFDVFDESCGTFLDTGVVYRPIGVYFKAVYASDVALPDIGVHVRVPVPVPGAPLPPPPGDSGAGDAGASDAGSSDAGSSDAGK